MTERHLLTLAATLAAVGLMVIALWAWGQSALLAQTGSRPQIMLWAIRSAAIAAGATAQLLMVTLIIGSFYRRGLLAHLAGVFATLVAMLALVSAIALGLAGK
jgi:hypothetical protein